MNKKRHMKKRKFLIAYGGDIENMKVTKSFKMILSGLNILKMKILYKKSTVDKKCKKELYKITIISIGREIQTIKFTATTKMYSVLHHEEGPNKPPTP